MLPNSIASRHHRLGGDDRLVGAEDTADSRDKLDAPLGIDHGRDGGT